MTGAQLKLIISELPNDIEIFIDDGNMLSPICGNFEVVKTLIGEVLEEKEILILSPCKCEIKEEYEEENFNLN